jgi:hypothetical protein
MVHAYYPSYSKQKKEDQEFEAIPGKSHSVA